MVLCGRFWMLVVTSFMCRNLPSVMEQSCLKRTQCVWDREPSILSVTWVGLPPVPSRLRQFQRTNAHTNERTWCGRSTYIRAAPVSLRLRRAPGVKTRSRLSRCTSAARRNCLITRRWRCDVCAVNHRPDGECPGSQSYLGDRGSVLCDSLAQRDLFRGHYLQCRYAPFFSRIWCGKTARSVSPRPGTGSQDEERFP